MSGTDVTVHRPQEFPFPEPQKGSVDVLIVAGEHSGDEQAARMVATLLARRPELRVAAIGGPRLAAAGAQLLFDLTASSVVGLVEVLRNLGFFRRVFNETLRWIETHRPKVVCFVDYPGFNLRMARALAAAGISVKGGGTVRSVYYISPQIWAWKARRRFSMAEMLDSLAVIFPFEVECYKDTILPVRFVGHPFVGPDYKAPLRYDQAGPVLLLAGSRRAAVGRIAPVLLDGFEAYRKGNDEARAVMIYPSAAIRELLEAELARRPGVREAVSLVANSEQVAAAAVLTSSGTMSLTCALAGIPGAIAYRANPITYRLGRLLVKVPYIGIGNLILSEPIYPEFIQGAARPDRLAAELRDCLENPERVLRTKRLAAELREALARPPEGDAANWLAGEIEAARRGGAAGA
ncbi:MAG: lipid-A-disaccharide synthase [Verrucomicrobia bacterium]|nr:MAG: lipid-A-disaccharide synthase [Verrucomicrobiota bacterium]